MSSFEYFGWKKTGITTMYKIVSKCDFIIGSSSFEFGEPIIFSHTSNKPRGFEKFCEPQILKLRLWPCLSKKLNKFSKFSKVKFCVGGRHQSSTISVESGKTKTARKINHL